MNLKIRKLCRRESAASGIRRSLMACATAILLFQGTAAAADSWIARYDGGIGSSWDFLTDSAVDAAGNRYLAGRNGEGYVTVKYGPDGSEKWRAVFAGGDSSASSAVNERGEVYVAGRTLVKYSPAGKELWNVQTALSAWRRSVGVVIDADGNVLVSGRPSATTVKYDPDGNELWRAVYRVRAKKWKGPDLALDASGNAYVFVRNRRALVVVKYDGLGRQLWERGIPSELSRLGPDGALYVVRERFLAKYGTDGSVLWEKEVAVGTSSGVERLDVDMDGNVYLLGSTFEAPDGRTSFVAKYDPAGTPLWLFRGQPSEELLWPVQAVDPEGNVYYVANTRPKEADVGAVVAVKVSPTGAELWRSPLETPIGGSLQLIVTPEGEAFLAASEAGDLVGVNLAPDGSESWRVRVDVPMRRRDRPEKVVVDDSGGVYVLGRSEDDMACQPVLMKYGPDGRELWMAHLEENVCGHAKLAVDVEGHAIVASPVATTKYDSEGNQLWSVPDGRATLSVTSLILDAEGGIYSKHWLQSRRVGQFVKRDPDGNTLWEREISPPFFPVLMSQSIAVDGSGNSYLVRGNATTKYDVEGNEDWVRRQRDETVFLSAVFVDASGDVYASGARHGSVVTTKYDSEANEVWTRQWEGVATFPVVGRMITDATGNVYVAGGSRASMRNRRCSWSSTVPTERRSGSEGGRRSSGRGNDPRWWMR